MVGGAELMLWKLLSRIDRDRYDPVIYALSSRADHILRRFDAIGVSYHLLGITPNARAAAGLVRLARKLKETQPDLIQGWLPHGNIAATISRFISRLRTPVLWSIRGAPIPDERRLARAVARLGAIMASSATKIVYNSTVSAAEYEERLGYRRDKRLVIPNGFDTDLFAPCEEARVTMRRALGLPEEALVIGLIARYHPVKDHENFLRAAALVSKKHPHARYLLVGESIHAANVGLRALIAKHDATDRVHLLGMCDDMPRITAALDICVSSSTVEGFSNVVGEAMSCGVPCVVTDVGDSAWLVGDTGKNVPPRDPVALASAIESLATMTGPQRAALGHRARERIIRNFSLDHIVAQYQSLYSGIYDDARAGKA
jgi:glycosyltransferase involved in cell wall biosynthesis